jgi:DNA-binding FadR family transcriptional regulator
VDPDFPSERHARLRTKEHRKLVTKFAGGDADNLREAIEAHLGNSRTRLRGSYLPGERAAGE